MKASENPSIVAYMDRMCFPIGYATLKLDKLIDVEEGQYRYLDMPLNPMNTRTLVRLDRTMPEFSADEIILDTHSKGRSDRKYESKNTDELDSVSYQPLDNSDFIKPLIRAIDNSGLDCTNATIVEHVHSRNGSATWGSIKFKDHPINIELPNGNTSVQYPSIDWTNSYDRTFRVRFWAGLYGGVCLNQQVFAGFSIMQYTHKHIKRKNGTSGIDPEVINDKIFGVMGSFDIIKDKCEYWAKVPLSKDDAKDILSKTLAYNTQTRRANEKKLAELMDWWESREVVTDGANLWSLYNTATYYATHGLWNNPETTNSHNSLAKLQNQVLFMIQSPSWIKRSNELLIGM